MGCSSYSSAVSKNRREKKKKRKEIQRGQTADCCRVFVVDWLLLGDPNKFRDNLPRNSHFRQVGLLDIVLSEYPDKSHDNFLWRHTSRPANLVWKKRRPWGRGSYPSHNSFQGASNQIYMVVWLLVIVITSGDFSIFSVKVGMCLVNI